MGAAFRYTISRGAAVVAPGLMVMAINHIHGEGVGRTPQPGRQPCVRAAEGFRGDGCPATSSCTWSARRWLRWSCTR